MEGDADPSEDYVDLEGQQPVIRKRSPLDVDYTTDGLVARIRGIPAGAEVIVAGHRVITEGSDLVVEFEVPGSYLAVIYPPPRFLRKRLEVTVG